MIRRGEGGVERRGGPSWSPVGGEAIVFLHDGSQGNRTRATMKAHPSTLHPPSPLRSTQRHFVRLMRMTADLSAVGRAEHLPIKSIMITKNFNLQIIFI